MLRFGAVVLFASLTMATVALAAENPTSSVSLGAKVCPSAEIGTPAPIFITSCFACVTNTFTGPTLTATDVDCTTATSDLKTALRHAATADCQSQGYDNYCIVGSGGSLAVHITSACSTSSSGTSVSGYATYPCQVYNC